MGNLITEGISAGTPDYGVVGIMGNHISADVTPFHQALALDAFYNPTAGPGNQNQYVNQYLENRPPNQGDDCD